MRRVARLRLLASVAAIAVIAGGVPVSTQAEAPVRSDISRTPNGRAIAADAKARFREYRPDGADEALRVVRLEDGSVMVVPASYGTGDIQLGRDGSVRLTTQAVSTSSDPAAPLAVTAASWSQQGPTHCFSRTTIKTPNGNNGGYMDTCYRLHKLTGETSSWDYWNITAFATFDATRANTIGDYAWIHVDRDGGGTWYWEDWDPRSDRTANCADSNLGVTVLGVGLGFNNTLCETWILTKYAAAGTLKVQWNGDSTGTRDVALMAAIHVANGVSPIWGISWNSALKCRPGFVC